MRTLEQVSRRRWIATLAGAPASGVEVLGGAAGYRWIGVPA